ncbi:MAG: PEP/pyruvate-binding domain-containing protein [Myxococcota bacterium]
MTSIVTLGEATAADAESIGNKARYLATLLQAGFVVPPGFVIGAQVLGDVVRRNGLAREFAGWLAAIDHAAPSELASRAAFVRRSVRRLTLGPALVEAIAHGIEVLRCRGVCVRSSSSLEDGARQTFAGQHDTRVNVTTVEQAIDAIREVWASAWSDRAVRYLNALGRSVHEVRMGVIIQALVDADVSGVALTAHPVTGSRDYIVLSASCGLGEGTVAGLVAPERLVVLRAPVQLMSRTAGYRPVELVAREGGGVEERAVPEQERRSEVLGEEQALRIATIARRIETMLGDEPVDIEWAIADDEVHVLQARPMVIPGGVGEVSWESPVPGARWRHGWRLGEWLRGPVTPLFRSWVLPKLVAARERSGTGALGWALEPSFAMAKPWYCLVNGYFFSRRDGPRPEQPQGLARFWQHVESTERWHRTLLPEYLAHYRREHARFAVEAASSAELLARVETLAAEAGELWYMASAVGGFGFEERVFRPYYERVVDTPDRPHFSALFGGYRSRVLASQQVLYELARDLEADPTASRILAPVSERPGGSLEELPAQFRVRIDGYCAEFGHQLEVIDLYHRPPACSPLAVLGVVRSLLGQRGESPMERCARAERARERAHAWVRDYLAGDTEQYESMEARIRSFQASAAVREDALFYFQYGWPLMRRIVDELAQRLSYAGAFDDPELIYFLEADELYELIAAQDRGRPWGVHSRLEARQDHWRAQCLLEPPRSLGPTEESGPTAGKGYVVVDEGARIEGDGASPGIVRGRVRIVHELADMGRVAAGDVVVVHTASPALTPILLIAGAMVVDIGGGSSHSSLVARELGLPTVVNAVDASTVLHEGALVEVDGTRGAVRILSQAAGQST